MEDNVTEQDRQIVIKRIKEDIENLEIRNKILERKRMLEQDEKVKEYSYIINEILCLDKKLAHITTNEDAVNLEFIWAFKSRIDDKKMSPCNHQIWMYTGSYSEIFYQTIGYYNTPCDNEESECFLHNEYICLECGEIIRVSNWEEFEQSHIVLKNMEDIDIEKYMALYYQLLYTHSIEEAQNLIIQEFNKNITEPKKKIKQK